MSLSDVLSTDALEVDAGRTDQLRHDDALGAVDDEGALVGHQREVAHEDRLRLDLAGLVVHELGGDEQRRRVGEVAVLALVDGVLRRLEPVVAEAQRHRALEVLDRADLLEDLLEPGLVRDRLAGGSGLVDPALPDLVAEQPVEALDLEVEQIRDRQRLGDLGETQPRRHGRWGVDRAVGVTRGGQEASFRARLTARDRSDPHSAVPRQRRSGAGRGRDAHMPTAHGARTLGRAERSSWREGSGQRKATA